MAEISVREAARELGVDERRVRALIQAGRLPARKLGGVWAIEASAPRRLVERRAGRPLSAANAWALLALLSGGHPDWIDPAAASRLRRKRSDPDWLVRTLVRSEHRSEVHRWRVLDGDLTKIRDGYHVVPAGLSAQIGELDIVSPPRGLDAYVDRRLIKQLSRRFRPVARAAQPNLILRVPAHGWILGHTVAPPAVIAADLLDHEDPRVRRAARRLLTTLATHPHP